MMTSTVTEHSIQGTLGKMTSEADSAQPLYRIGAVSRLTGIPTETIRMWERRYQVVDPCRSQGRNRLYSREDIGRLALIKRLVDAGNAISTVADLTLEQLQERLSIYTQQTPLNGDTKTPAAPRVAVLGDALPARVTQFGEELRGIDVVAVHRDQRRFETEVRPLRPDAILLEYPSIHDDTADIINRMLHQTGAQRAIVVYGFGRQSAVQNLDTAQILPMRAPVGLPELRQVLLAGVSSGELPITSDVWLDKPAPGVIPPRRYPSESLVRIAAASTVVHCECPHHLVELLFSLTAFESYSKECKNRSPEDAELHSYLHATAAQARSLLEEALTRVVEAEGLQY